MRILLVKIIALFVSMLNVLMPNAGIIPASVNTVTRNGNGNYADADATEALAAELANRVNAVYGDTDRDSFVVSNANAVLTHSLDGIDKTATLTDTDGNTYFSNTLRTFYTTKDGIKRYFENCSEKGRDNSIRMGTYYYDCNIRDFELDGFYVDKGLRVWSDRMFIDFSMLASEPTTKVQSFGIETVFADSDLRSFRVYKDGKIVSNSSSCDITGADFVAFDTRDAGIVGFILSGDDNGDRIVIKKNYNQVILHIYANYTAYSGLNAYTEEGGYDLNRIGVCARLYTDSTHTYTGIKEANRQEKNPLEVTVTDNDSNAQYMGYNTKTGCYEIKMDGTNFNAAYSNPQLRYSAPFTVKNDGRDRDVYFRVYTDCGGLESGVLLDGDGNQAAVMVETCKNFCGDYGDRTYNYVDRSYGDSFFPVASEKNSEQSFTAVHLYQNWGNYPLKQLSSIEFGDPYYHLSTGVTESNCIAPQYAGGKCGFVLPDFRTASGIIWAEQPQYNSTGTPKFNVNRDSLGNEYYGEFSGAYISESGPVYADITGNYTDDNGGFTYTLRHVEMPQNDQNRTYYSMKITFTKDVTFRNFKENFDFFYYDGRFCTYKTKFWLDENGQTATADVNTGKSAVYSKLGTNCPFIGLCDTNRDGYDDIDGLRAGCNVALLVKSSSATLGGTVTELPLMLRDSSTSDVTTIALTADWGKKTFSKGDTIEINFILLPYADNQDPDISAALSVREDSCINPATLSIATGTQIEDTYIPTVKAENGKAEFTLTGGASVTSVKVTGFESKTLPTIYTVRDGQISRLELASVWGYDGYSVRLCDDGTYSFSFVADTSSAVTYIISQD